jgi:NitT/TauT family transport system permease protein
MHRSGVQAGISSRLLAYILPVIAFVIVLSLWEAAVHVFRIPLYLLPAPSAIFEVFINDIGYLFRIGMVTFGEAVGGFLIGCGLGSLVAALCVRWNPLADGMIPFAVAASAVPIVALSPIMGIWLGSTSIASKIGVVAVMTFFPTLVNVYRGLSSPHPDAISLLRSYAASQPQIFLKLRVPAALPYFFNALKICSTLSMIGAVVAEFFGGIRNSLGVYIKTEASILHTREAWAAILVACILGISFYLVIVLLERWVMPWQAARQQ